MPANNGSRSDHDERLRPLRPECFQHDPEQLVRGCQSTAWSFGMQSEQLLTESEIFKDEVLSRSESADDPAEKMPQRHEFGRNQGQNLIETMPPPTRLQIIHSASARGFDEAQAVRDLQVVNRAG